MILELKKLWLGLIFSSILLITVHSHSIWDTNNNEFINDDIEIKFNHQQKEKILKEYIQNTDLEELPITIIRP